MNNYENILLSRLFNIKAENIINDSQPKQPKTTLQLRKEHKNILKK